MKTYSSDEEMNEFKHILINSFVIALSLDDPFGDCAEKARLNLKLISDIKEEGYEDDSLFFSIHEINGAIINKNSR